MNRIITPIFLKASETSRDNFWKCFFQDLSFGIYPTGIFLSDSQTLSCRVKGCEFDYEIPTNVGAIHRELRSLLTEKLGIESSVNLQHINTSLQWSVIKKKSQRERLIEQYAIRLMTEHGLTTYQTRTVQAFLMLGFELKVIENKDVRLNTDQYCIESIDGVDIINNQLVFTNPIRVEPIKQAKGVSSLRMIEIWDKFLKTT